ncbi:MAG: class I SAM-dependent methyltransferase [Fuerstiella sp.]
MKIAFEGIAIGLMPTSDVDDYVSDGYKSSVPFYDPRTYELPHESGAIDELKQVATGTRLLDAFCGQGREAKLLNDAGFDVTGIDVLAPMITNAQRYASDQSFSATFLVADFATFHSSPRFDVVYTSCWMYSTFQGRRRRLEFLRRCTDLCRESGTIVISFDPQVESKFKTLLRHSIARITALVTLGNMNSEIGERVGADNGLFWHCHTVDQVHQEVRDAGLYIVKTLHGTGGAPTTLILCPGTLETQPIQNGGAK